MILSDRFCDLCKRTVGTVRTACCICGRKYELCEACLIRFTGCDERCRARWKECAGSVMSQKIEPCSGTLDPGGLFS